MINIIWGLLILIGLIYAFFSGNISVINNEIISSAKTGLNMVLEILPIMVVWMGLMKIAELSGLLTKFSKAISKPLSILFPSIPKDNIALSYIASNIAANMLGLGSAATPLGLKAMEEMQKLNKKKDSASDAMITFLVINTSGITIIPTTVIALRSLHKSTSPTEIIISAFLASTIAIICGLIIDFFIRRKNSL